MTEETPHAHGELPAGAGESSGVEPSRKPLSPAAQRALAEAEERRAAALERAREEAQARHKELQGPKGLEPTRYGDWERKGITSDF
jgi:hypothetical protein